MLALLVVGGGATAAILVLKGGGGSIGGEDTREALVTKTLAALEAGDGAALVALAADESRADELMDCGDKKKKDDDKENKERIEHRKKSAREDADKLAATTKGKGFVLDETTEDKQRHDTTIKKGEKVGGEDCTSTVELAFHDLALKVHDGSKKKATVKFDTVVLDGHWFLGRAPTVEEASDCTGAIAHMLAITKADLERAHTDIPKLTQAMVKHCEKDGWPDKTVHCFATAKVGTDAETCMATLTSSQTDAVTKDMIAALGDGKPVATAPVAPTTPPPSDDNAGSDTAGSDTAAPTPTPSASGADGMPPECADYAKLVERTMACKLMPPESRDAMKKALEMLTSNAKALPPEALKSVADACKQGADALKQALSGIGC